MGHSAGTAPADDDGADWRVTISLPGSEHVGQARQSLSEHQVEDDVRRRLGRGVAVGSGDSCIYLYAGTENSARQAEQTAREVLGQLGVEAGFQLHRWHPIEEDWESPDVAMPSTEAEREAEEHRLEQSERAESLASGEAQWDARVEFPTHREAVALARKLRGEGRSVIRRWKFLVVAADSEEDATELADQIRREAPPGARITTEGSGLRLPFIPY